MISLEVGMVTSAINVRTNTRDGGLLNAHINTWNNECYLKKSVQPCKEELDTSEGVVASGTQQGEGEAQEPGTSIADTVVWHAVCEVCRVCRVYSVCGV